MIIERNIPSTTVRWVWPAALAAVLVTAGLQFVLWSAVATSMLVVAYLLSIVTVVSEVRRHDGVLAAIFLVALAIRIVFLFASRDFLLFIGLEEGSPGQSDPLTYAQVGWDYAQLWRTGEYSGDTILYGSIFWRHTYYAWNALLYYVLGEPVFIVPVMINLLLGGLTSIVAGFCAGQFGLSLKTSRIVAILTALDPHMLVFSSMNMKEVWIGLALTFCIWSLLSLRRHVGTWLVFQGRRILTDVLATIFEFQPKVIKKCEFGNVIWPAAILVLSIVALLLFRPILVGLILLGVGMVVINRMFDVLNISLLGRLILGISTIGFAVYGSHPLANKIQWYMASVEHSYNLSSLELSQSLFSFAGGSLLEKPYIFPVLAGVSILGTFPPWRLDATWLSILLRPGTIWLHLMLPFIVVGGYKIYRDQTLFFGLSLVGTLVLGYFLVVVVVTKGTPEAIRYISPTHVFLWFFAAVGLEYARKGVMQWVLLLYPAVIGLLAVIYYTIKLLIHIGAFE